MEFVKRQEKNKKCGRMETSTFFLKTVVCLCVKVIKRYVKNTKTKETTAYFTGK